MTRTPNSNETNGAVRVADLRARYLAALTGSDRPRAAAVVSDAIARGLDLPTLVIEVLSAAQAEVGALWLQGELSVSQEHWASRVTEEQIGRLLEVSRPQTPLDLRVVVTTVPGELHTLPTTALACLLRWRGWSVDYLGSGPPIDDLLDFVRQRAPHMVAVSITLADLQPALAEVCRELRRIEPSPVVIVGGSGTAGLRAEILGVEAVAGDAREALDLAERFFDLGVAADLESYLAAFGLRVREGRERERMSQEDLAKRSGLSRSYLSAVERGRQNITLDAAMKIARALRISVARLLDDRPKAMNEDDQ